MPTEPDWYHNLAAALASRQIDSARIDGIVAEAKAHCTAAAESPQVAFGDADTYAKHITSADEERFHHVAVRHTGATEPVAFRVASWIGVSLATLGAIGWLASGTWHTLTASDLAFWITNFLTIFCILLRGDARDAGRPSTGRRLLLGCLAILAVGTTITLYLPRTDLLRVPFPGLLLAGAAIWAAGWWLGDRWTKAHPPVTTFAHTAWLDRLAGLLEGRHRLSAGRAQEFRAEAASHLAESGGDPEQEFGPVDDYAAELAERSGLQRPRRAQLGCLLLQVLGMLITGTLTGYAIQHHGVVSIRSAILAIITLLFVSSLSGLVWEQIRRRRGAAKTLQQ
ncbi:hypothetical protein [Actinopolymorpha pittospori]|uniref:Uncharacterized protein n=1 Tax=Actinopolymorpha pittospori TaxID=648752 RepID=A0A927MXB5_9ACTN|nr:hypothetical protein [Actinopolymorpha pittospori]MBE1606463.1 hypothetical protein [Actinopolymorpha pittospori]